MFDKSKVTNRLFGLVGFKDSANPDMPVLSNKNKESRSGGYATDNPYVKIESLYESMDYHDADDADFNSFLETLQRNSIADVVDSVLVNPAYIDRQMLYQFANNKVETEVLPDGFVGFRIQKSLDKNVAFEITRCILEFEGEGVIKLVLFNSAIKEPIKESEIITVDSRFKAVNLGWKIDNSDDYFQGDFYFGYFTNSLSIQPFKRSFQNANVISVVSHLHFSPISAVGAEGELFDLNNIQNSSNCFGLNPDISVYNDYTDLIIQNERLFASAIQMQIVINSIQTYIASIRSNRTDRITKENLSLLIAQVEGVPGQIEGLKPTLRKDIQKLSAQINRLKDGYFARGFLLNTLT